MSFPRTLICELCGAEATVVFNHGFDQHGRRALKPALVESAGDFYVFVDCLVHGRVAQRVDHPIEELDEWRPPRKPK
jgi:hypothetical protein